MTLNNKTFNSSFSYEIFFNFIPKKLLLFRFLRLFKAVFYYFQIQVFI